MIAFNVEGRPAPKGSRIQMRSKSGKAYTRPASKHEKPWTDAVRGAAQIAMRHAVEIAEPYAIELEFRCPRPVRIHYLGRDHPTAADLDKLERATLDGLVQGNAISDDRHVTALTSRKRYANVGEPTGVSVRITHDAALQALSDAA